MIIDTEEPLAIAVVEAIHTGDVAALRRLLADNPGLADAQLGGDPDNKGDGGMTRSAELDWIGYDDLTPIDVAQRSEATELVEWLRPQGARSTAELA